MGALTRRAYIARYPASGIEQVLLSDSYWSPDLEAEWDRLVVNWAPGDALMQGWYADNDQVVLMCQIFAPTTPRVNTVTVTVETAA